jgi:hypothetical protein
MLIQRFLNVCHGGESTKATGRLVGHIFRSVDCIKFAGLK